MPPFENIVHQKPVTVTPEAITCGLRSVTEFCVQTNGIYRECDYCQDGVPDKEHPPRFLTDTHEDYNQTWWQSVTMQEDVHTYKVNLTVNLGETQLCMFSSASVKETVNCMKHNPS